MKQVGKYLLLSVKEFEYWLNSFEPKRFINHIQQHHTWIPAYKHFNQQNHFKLCQIMEKSHLERGFNEIAQNITTFPDGTIMLCRNLNTQPAGIKFANSGGICIENIGNFDEGKDKISDNHRIAIVACTRLLLQKFGLTPNDNSVVYHHWYHLGTGGRNNGGPSTTNKSCPGTGFFGGNRTKDFNENFLPLIKNEIL